MKRISFFLVLTLILISFGLANAAKEVYVDFVEGEYDDGGPMLPLNSEAVFHIHVTNDGTPDCFFNPAFGFQVCDDAGTNPAAWTGLALGFDEFVRLDTVAFVPDVFIVIDTLYFDANFSDFFIEYQPATPTGGGCDSVGVAGVASAPPGLEEGMDQNLFTISFTPTVDDSRICLDIAPGMPSYEWNWSGLAVDFEIAPCEPNGPGNPPDIFADWGGPYCYGVGVPPDLPPVIGGGACAAPPTTISGNHCATLTGSFCAEDPDPGQGPGPDDVTYDASLGTINATTGAWTSEGATFTCEDEQASITLVVYAYEADNAIYDSVLVNINVTNETPTFAGGCDVTKNVSIDEKITYAFTVEDDCADALTYGSSVVSGTFIGTAEMNGDVFEVTPGEGCPSGLHEFTVTVEDCEGGDECTVFANVILGQEYEVVIQKTHDTPQGQFEDVAVSMNQQAGEIGGFNFLIAYDASALTFQGATPGPLFDEVVDGGCDWEYFTYRYGPDGNCGNACPSGLLRVVGIAETNNGPYHPECFGLAVPYDLFYLSFLVSNNRTFECSYVPIRFFWIECGDNTISDRTGDILYISSNVLEYDWDPTDAGAYLLDVHWTQEDLDAGVYGDPAVGMPWYMGADWTCDLEDKTAVQREVGFYNGGIDIICAKDIDDRGDINQNGLAYEIADAVMFSNYFVYGLGAFVDGFVNGSIAATDVNADGLTLSVADLVYLVRVIVGDALPYDDPFLKPTVASYTYHNGVVSVNSEMGAAAFTFDGDVNVELLADNMELKYHFDGEITRAVVFSLDGNTFSGDVVRGSNMVTLELGSADGATVVTNMLPSEFALSQNYPNPFNPTTAVPFALPVASEVTLTVYNVTGQVVAEMGGAFEAGEHAFDIDGSNLSSGVYFYRLDAGTFTATKKMVLLK